MDFYTIVLIVAIILLIAVLTGLSLMLKKVGTTTAFPPTSNTCPDGWTSGTDSNGNITCTSGTTTTNKPSSYVVDSTYSKNSPGYINWYYSSNTGNFNGGVTGTPITDTTAVSLTINKGIVKNICDQQRWANANKIIWDGVTNSNAKC